VISALLQNKADLNRKDSSGRKAVDIARTAGHGDDVLDLFKQSPQGSRATTEFWPAAGLVASPKSEASKPLLAMESKPSLEPERSGDDSPEGREEPKDDVEEQVTAEAVDGASPKEKKVSKLKRITVSRKSKLVKAPAAESLQVGEANGDLRIDESLLAEDAALEVSQSMPLDESPEMISPTSPGLGSPCKEGDGTKSPGKKVVKTRIVKKKSTKDVTKSPENTADSPGGLEEEEEDENEDSKDDRKEEKESKEVDSPKRKSVVKRVVSIRKSKAVEKSGLDMTSQKSLPDMTSNMSLPPPPS